MAAADRFGQRRLVHQPAARGVDDDDARLGLGQRVLVDQAGRLGCLGQVHRDEVGAGQQFVQGQQFDAQLRGAGRRHVGVVGDDVGAERRDPLGDQLADAAQPHDADGLAEDLGARELRALPGVFAQRGVGRRDLPGRGQQQRQACSAALWMFDVGALTTSTPRSVAASTSTLSRPTPARATIFSLGAAASTSASTVVAERTSSASASGTAASSFSRSGPSTQRTSTWSPRAATVDWASLSAINTTGKFTRPGYRPSVSSCN